jgi:putative endonuclease
VAQPRRDARGRLGSSGEAAVAGWYERAGYEVVDRNWRCTEGELDLVVRAPRLIVFCEVKTRRSEAFGAPFEAVTMTKQRRLRLLAARWLATHPQRGADIRFDVASVLAAAGHRLEIDVIEGAF